MVLNIQRKKTCCGAETCRKTLGILLQACRSNTQHWLWSGARLANQGDRDCAAESICSWWVWACFLGSTLDKAGSGAFWSMGKRSEHLVGAQKEMNLKSVPETLIFCQHWLPASVQRWPVRFSYLSQLIDSAIQKL